ncbi:enoyl-CoA hydratase/isomerase family protein [bacterium]|nr:enoyl-CoA hydratase/isomerase family protein [bacterium]
MSDYKLIRVKESLGRFDIVLNNPPVNILNIAMMEEICDALEKAAMIPGLKVVVYRAEGKHFSAGADVGEHSADQVVDMIGAFGRMFRCMSRVPAINVALVEGSALGGGCELATFCDIVLASEKAKLGQPEILLGVFPPIAVVTFPILVGRNRAIELLVTGKIIAAEEAEKIGLVNHVYPTAEFAVKTDELIGSILALSASSIALTKKVIDRAMYQPVMEAFRHTDREYIEELMKTEDANEGIAAFLEKRKPQWKDR